MFSTQQYFGFDPRTIPGCQIWLDAADSNTMTFASGTNISQWSDKSGNSYHATQSIAGRYPTYDATNKRVNFTRTVNSYFLLPNNALPVGNSAYTYYIVLCFTTVAEAMGVIGGGNWGTNGAVFALRSFDGANARLITYWWNVDFYTSTGAYSANVPLMIMTDWNGTTRTIVKNGTQIATNNPGTARNQGSSNNAIGSTNNLNEFMEGYMNEIIVFNRALTSAENKQIEGYLAWKWGLNTSLSTGHPFRPNPNFQRIPSPLDFGPMLFWWDAADYGTFTPANPTAGTSITGWTDKVSGLTLSNSNASPTWQTDGVRFTNPSSTISTSSQNLLYYNVSSPYRLTQAYTIIVAHSPNLFTGLRNAVYISAPAAFNTNPSFWGTVGNGATEGSSVGAFNGAGSWLTLQQTTSVITTAGSRRIDSILSQSSSNFVWTNGTENTYGTNNINRGATATGTAVLDYISMSTTSNISGNRAYDGTIHEVLVYSSNLSSNAIRQVEAYLAWKWNVRPNLVSTHPFFRIPTSSPLFTPTAVSGAVLWLDAADSSTITGNPVSTWTDKSTGGFNATSPAGPSVSTYNGYPVVTFNGSSQYLNNSLTIPLDSHTLIAVHRPATITGNTQGNTSLFRFQNANYIVFPYMNGTTPRGYITNRAGSGAGSLDATNSTLVENSVTTSFNIIIANIASGSQIIRRNGTQQSSNNRTITGGTSDTLCIGRPTGVNLEYYQGDLAEMIIFNTTLTTSQIQQVEGYLAWKWGLKNSLPTTHPYYKFRP